MQTLCHWYLEYLKLCFFLVGLEAVLLEVKRQAIILLCVVWCLLFVIGCHYANVLFFTVYLLSSLNHWNCT